MKTKKPVKLKNDVVWVVVNKRNGKVQTFQIDGGWGCIGEMRGFASRFDAQVSANFFNGEIAYKIIKCRLIPM